MLCLIFGWVNCVCLLDECCSIIIEIIYDWVLLLLNENIRFEVRMIGDWEIFIKVVCFIFYIKKKNIDLRINIFCICICCERV